MQREITVGLGIHCNSGLLSASPQVQPWPYQKSIQIRLKVQDKTFSLVLFNPEIYDLCFAVTNTRNWVMSVQESVGGLGSTNPWRFHTYVGHSHRQIFMDQCGYPVFILSSGTFWLGSLLTLISKLPEDTQCNPGASALVVGTSALSGLTLGAVTTVACYYFSSFRANQVHPARIDLPPLQEPPPVVQM